MSKGHSDIAALLRAGAEFSPDAIAIEDGSGTCLSYAELERLTIRIAETLQAGPSRTDGRRRRFGIVMPNGSDIAITLLGATVAGEAAPFNPNSTAHEFDMYFESVGIDALIMRQGDTGPAVESAARGGIPVLRLLGDRQIAAFDTNGSAGGPASGTTGPRPDDVALVLMTSGSTGRPKIVPLTHRNVCRSAWEVGTSLALTPNDVCLAMWEQFHIGGLVDLLLAPLTSHSRLFVTPGFEVKAFFRLLDEVRPTWFQAVPTTLNELVLHAERHDLVVKPNSLRFIRSVAAALSPAVMERAVECFGVPVIRTFGMTEASPLITTTPLPPLPQKPGSVGRSCGTEIRVFGQDGGDAPPGTEGEIGIRGENVFSGYRGDDEANRASFRDGWFLTGDVGYVDADGDLFLTGRIKQMINRGGEKISPQEVDDVLARHPAVAEAATFAVRHRTLGEDIAAAVVLREPIDPAALRAFALKSLAPFKVPHRIVVQERLPRNPVGKIDRLALARGIDEEGRLEPPVDTAPRTDMERLVAELWARELFLPSVGVDRDFGSLGGDSLSMLRILLALEAALGRPVPIETLSEHSTVARIAAELTKNGYDVASADRGDGETVVERAKRSLDAVTDGTKGFADPAAEFSVELKICADRKRLKSIQNSATIYATARELEVLLDRATGAVPGSASSSPIGLFDRLKLRLDHWSWKRGLRRELAAHPSARAWTREILSESAIAYRGAGTTGSGKRLIVGFTGNFARLMLPTYRILAVLDPGRFDLLLLRDPAKALFVTGARGLGSDLRAVADFAQSFAESGGYGGCIGFGTSGGGPAAICSALTHRWSRAVAVCPPDVSAHPGLAALLADAVAGAGSAPPRVILVHGSAPRDIEAVRRLKRDLAFATVEAQSGYKTHNIIREAWDGGRLDQLFATWFADVEHP